MLDCPRKGCLYKKMKQTQFYIFVKHYVHVPMYATATKQNSTNRIDYTGLKT